MGCSSCQQNNHVVPTNTTHTHATPLCECACGCSEPVCPTPQPCTEITDSKCIIYTDAAIKCGNTTIVTTNASVSTALNQIVTYFCNLTTPTVTEDVLCGTIVIVPAGSTLQEATELIVNWVCQLAKDLDDVQDTINAINTQIVTLNACCDNNTETNLNQDEQIAVLQNQVNAIVPHYKFVHEQTSSLFGDVIIILRDSLESCNVLPSACSTDPFVVDKMCDLHISVYRLSGGFWIQIPSASLIISIDDTSGDIGITINMAVTVPPVPVRVVILA